MADVSARIKELKAQANDWFEAEGVDKTSRNIDVVLDTRYVGQNFELAIGLGRRGAAPDPRTRSSSASSPSMSVPTASTTRPTRSRSSTSG